MKRIKRLMALTLALIMLASCAAAEITFLPQLKSWTAEEIPLRLKVSAEIISEASSGERRLEQLQALMKHLSLQVDIQQLQDETWSRTHVMVDKAPALTLSMREMKDMTLLQASVLPDTTYQAAAITEDPLSLLVGGGTEDVIFPGMDFSGAVWLKDAEAMLAKLAETLAPYGKPQKVDVAIKNMGKAKVRTTYTIPAEEAARLAELLPPIAGTGALAALVKQLKFSGKQQFLLYHDANDAILKVTYEGRCGISEEDMRDVSLSWSLRRDDDNTRDIFTLKTPALEGNSRNNLTLTRVALANKNGAVTMKLDARMEVVANKQMTSWECEGDLKSVAEEDKTRLTGTFTLKNTAPDDTTTKLIITPDVLLGDAETPSVKGNMNVKKVVGSNTVIEAKLKLTLAEGAYFNWDMTPNTLQMENLSKKELASLQEKLASGAVTSLVRHIALLPREDTLYLFDGLDEQTMEKIIDISRKALQEEEAQ